MSHSRYEERLALLSLAPNAGVIQISSVGAAQLSPCPVNPLRASAWRAGTQRQRHIKGKRSTDVQQIQQTANTSFHPN